MTQKIAAGVTNLKLKFAGEDALLFKGVSLAFRPGEHALLLGPSGCGKSTLLQVLSGLIPGSIEVPMIADEVIVPERWGYVFQDPDTQFCMPYVDEELAFVLENLQVPREDMPARIERHLRQVGLSLPDSHVPIQTLSQGMKQRLAIASALATEPEVLFLDEPTALLDEEGTEQVWQTIRSLADGMTLIVVEHKIEGIIDLFDRIVVIGPAGEVVADGAAREVISLRKKELDRYGVWYPGIWDDRPSLRRSPLPAPDVPPLLAMERYRGLRGSVVVIEAEQADVYPGDWIGIMGDNGAGKSSLLLAIMRLIKTEGVCEVAGRELKKVEHLAEHAAFVFQNPELQFVTHSVRDEIEYSLAVDGVPLEERRARSADLMDALQLLESADRHPYQLSMGQKRRLSVASAIIRGQRLLLLDEPTFGLDARNTFAMLDLLERLRAEGMAIVMVTHDPRIVERYCTKLWRVREGRLTHAIDVSTPANMAASR
ncbi:ABC transporter ATP-binding protein [Cohnella terricola]|uniref:ATP-binding cassette domain-containing protein n=1 Tax=Cohnella terricola TaxID=1289167 RepID=A0A559JNB7_9BACL|nr:ATP-binding cassette domain-containing protein [Cohnella terricola]TVY01360.1 ATP-binding cassette domain-containing protein [Cohnella terricola]